MKKKENLNHKDFILMVYNMRDICFFLYNAIIFLVIVIINKNI